MATSKTIAIIGAEEKIGASIAKSLAFENDRLLLIAKNPEELASLRDDLFHDNPNISIEIISCAKEAAWEADVIIMAAPESEKEIATLIQEVATGKIVISVSDPLCRLKNSLNPSFAAATEELQETLAYSKVIKIFNASHAIHFIPSIIHHRNFNQKLTINK